MSNTSNEPTGTNNINQTGPNNPVFANEYFDGTYDPTQGTVYRTDDVLSNLLDNYTGEEIEFKKVDDPTAITPDDVIYREKDGEIFKRVFEGRVNIQWFGAICDFRSASTATDNTVSIHAAISFMKAITADQLDSDSRQNTLALHFPASDLGYGYGCSTDLDFGGGYNIIMDAPLYRMGAKPDNGAFITVGRSSENARLSNQNKYLKIWARTESVEWTGNEYTGIIIKNHVRTKIEIIESSGFEIGVKFLGENGAFSYNMDIYIGSIINSRVGLDLNTSGNGNSGYVTSSSFRIGRIGLNSTVNKNDKFDYDRIGIRLNGSSYTCESLTFYSGVIEGLLSSVNPNACGIPIEIIRGQLNSFLDFRHEGNGLVFMKVHTGSPNYANYASITYTNHSYARGNDLVKSSDTSNIVVTRRGLRSMSQYGIGRTIFSTGDLASKAVSYNENQLYIPNVERTATNGGYSVQLQNASLTEDGYLQLAGPQNNISFYLDTSRIKKFNILPNWDEQDKGKFYFYVFDGNMNKLPRTNNIVGSLNVSADYGEEGSVSYYSFYDRPNDQTIWVSENVKYIKIIIATDTSAVTGFYRTKLKCVDIISMQGDWSGGTFVNRERKSGLSVRIPTSGENKKGDILYNDDFNANPTIFCWVCVESGDPGVWKSVTLNS